MGLVFFFPYAKVISDVAIIPKVRNSSLPARFFFFFLFSSAPALE